MDTPDKSQIYATSLTKFENSPVFNYINSLSPIEPVKSIHTELTFSSVTFASPSSSLPSLQISSNRGSRFSLRRHQWTNSSISELPHSGNENTSEAVSEGVQHSDPRAECVECLTPGSSNEMFITEIPNKQLEMEIEIPKLLKYDSGSPNSNILLHNLTDAGSEILGTMTSPVESNKVSLEGGHLFERELHLRKICRIQKNEEVAGCEWVAVISDVADVFTSNSSITEDNIEEKDEISEDPGKSFISSVLQLPQEEAVDPDNEDSGDPSGSCKQSEMIGPVTQSEDIAMDETDQTPAILSGNLLDKLQQRSRRRCLVYEMAGVHMKKSSPYSNCSSSTSFRSGCREANIEKHLVPSKTGTNNLSSMSSATGLHLNELETTLNDGMASRHETVASRMQLTSMAGSISSSKSYFSFQNPLTTDYLFLFLFLFFHSNLVLRGNENTAMENAPQTSTEVVGYECDHSSPQKKRHKSEHAGSESCKRCNCRRSKCLKLYCECFAAGLYCVEPCSCQDCFNQLAHEGIVLETRKQIESRNPIAFAPKVIRSTKCESVTEFGEETKRTPSSARHKRGCNCRRSSCLKRYCECFQGGVGCSFSCRCEGCKNTFGRKDGADETKFEGEDSEAVKNDVGSCDDVVKQSEEKHPDIPIIPYEIARPIIQVSTFDGKLTKSCALAEPCAQLLGSLETRKSKLFGRMLQFKACLRAIPEDETPEILKSSSPIREVKLASPNSKRVSPPHHQLQSSAVRHSNRKLVLISVPPYPSLNPL
ncbi:CXC domain-containing protein [Cephalotus follicularis]|uniref:CXC domain-containing protein n=1 Tax=Cephalotus follicularis TaxID=3775 RepID=A0A1Q3CLP7_CEPFO|nr:CXC domain-containing protein [Cephalotus follicularis]